MNTKLYIIVGGIILALGITLLVGFNLKEDLTPSETITAFHELALSGELEDSKQYIANDILKGFENGAFWHYGSYGGFINDYKEKTKSIDPLENSLEISGDTATILVNISYSNGREEKDKYYLVKENGAWKIAE